MITYKDRFNNELNLNRIYRNRNVYDETFANGGRIYSNDVDIPPRIKKVLNKVNSSKANFVKRLKDANRKYIRNWDRGGITTHKLGVGTDMQGNTYIYPEVQEINGRLVDFTTPPYSPYAGMINAEERGDTVRIENFDDALNFTKSYKQYYPKGNTFANGGRIYIKPSHRGRFTALKERTGHSATWFKEHGTPAQKKMATFALNAKHWKH